MRRSTPARFDVNMVLLCADGLWYRNVTASHEPVGVKPLLQHGLSQDEREDFRAHDVLLQQ